MKKNLKLIGGLAALSILGVSNVYAKDCSELQAKINQAPSGSVVQAETCEGGSLEFSANKNITFDLYGKTIKPSNILIYGEVTVKDSLGNGLIDITTTGTKAAIMVKNKMTLESGNIKANGHAVAANGGNVTVNGGTITAGYCALSGNNTLGTMVFNVNGGNLISTGDIAVYMPGPISFTMTDGNVVGGLQFRMGDVNISGGKVQATQGVLDDLTVRYKSSGSVNYPDAISVISGVYTSSNGSNLLKLNITGGTFETTRENGHAVAIYDYGKVAQEKNINISGGTFTGAKIAYDIITLDDLGITPDADYNNLDLVGKINTTITGGNYSSDVSKYLTDEYVQTNGVVSKKQTESPADPEPVNPSETTINVEAPVIDSSEKVKEIAIGLADASSANNIIANAVAKLGVIDKNVAVKVNVANIKQDEIAEDNVKNMADVLKKSQPNALIGGYFDITLNVFESDSNIELGELSKLDSAVKFNVLLPEELKAVAVGYTRTYYVIRLHDGKAEILNADLNEDKNSISFETDKFSTYALAYKDTKDETIVPKTFDSIGAYLAVGIVTILSIIGLSMYLKKQQQNN